MLAREVLPRVSEQAQECGTELILAPGHTPGQGGTGRLSLLHELRVPRHGQANRQVC